MYRNEAIYPAEGTNTPNWAGRNGASNGAGLDEVIGRTRLTQHYGDTLQAFTALIEAGRIIERGQNPPLDEFRQIIPELNELRLTAVYLRKQINKGRYPKLKTAIPHIEKYVAMAMQYAQDKGFLPKPNNESYVIRQMRRWLKTRETNPKTKQELAWLES